MTSTTPQSRGASGAPPSQQELLGIFRQFGGTDEEYLGHHYDRFVATLAEVLKGGTPKRVLDIGGHWLHQAALYALRGTAVVSVDGPLTFERAEVRSAAAQMGVSLVTESVLETSTGILGLPESSFDLILFTEIIEHITFNPIQMWSAIYRALAPGGRIVVTTPNYYALRGRVWHPLRFLRWQGGGITIEDILRLHTYGHHWKEFSMAELVTYFRMLSEDFTIERAQFMERFGSSDQADWRERMAGSIEARLRWLRPNLHLEIGLPKKLNGIQARAGW